ncbi:MAG: glycerate kinase, partial [Oscillibacter sp.]
MSKWILVPDSFKGTMSSQEICVIMGEELLRRLPDAEIISVPVADGGEGSVDAFLSAVGGWRVETPCTGPDFRPLTAFYGVLAGRDTAVVEMAAAAGLPLMEGKLCAEGATTYGVGELLLAAVRNGAKRVIVGLGGSATNDGGCGCAAALGVRFLDGAGASFIPVGGTLNQICHIDTGSLSPLLKNVEIVTMCDIDNPLCGPEGASVVFGPQKGATPELVRELDANLWHLAEVIRQDLGIEIAKLPGAGAAGGMGGGMVAFLGSRLQMGIETVLDTVEFDRLLTGA